MWTGTQIIVKEKMSGAIVSALFLNYLFIRSYLSALVDMLPDNTRQKSASGLNLTAVCPRPDYHCIKRSY
jgi:hypothetical protein